MNRAAKKVGGHSGAEGMHGCQAFVTERPAAGSRFADLTAPDMKVRAAQPGLFDAQNDLTWSGIRHRIFADLDRLRSGVNGRSPAERHASHVSAYHGDS